MASNINYHPGEEDRGRSDGGEGEVLSVIRFSGLFRGSSKRKRARFTALNETEELNNEGGGGHEKGGRVFFVFLLHINSKHVNK